MKHYYSKFQKLLMLVSAILSVNWAVAQQITVTGVVTDANDNSTLPGVNVSVKGTTNGTVTDFDGKYSIQAEKGQTLVFSFMGYTSREETVAAPALNVSLAVETTSLNEVVVIGYGTVKKGDATGSVSAVSSKDFNKGAITTPQELLVGKASGVAIVSGSGAPGAGSEIRIRGGSSMNASNDPLIVVDGVPLDNAGVGGSQNGLAMVNPNDIESMTVLKDASATAIYGSRASNGVILITTKSAKAGKKLKVSYNSNLSVGTPAKLLETLTGDEYRAMVDERIKNNGLVAAAKTGLGTANTDWQKEIYQNAFSHDHNLSVAGSVKMLPYRLSVGFTDQSGLLKYSNMQRTTFALNLNPTFLDNSLKITLNAKGTDARNNFSNTDAIGAAIQFDPTQPIMNGNTRYGGYTAWTGLTSGDKLNGLPNNIATHNPVARLEFRDNQSTVKRFIGNAQFDYTMPFLKGLRANLNLAYDYQKGEGDDVSSPLASWSYREPEAAVRDYSGVNKNSLLDFYLNYTTELGFLSSKIDATAGYSWQHFYYEDESHTRPHEKTNDIYVLEKFNADKSEVFLVAFFGRVNYSIMDKYLFTATLRQDGSSRFAKENRWGLFPSFAFAWKINQEGFLKDITAINELKLRLGYGVTGQQDGIDRYGYVPQYRISTAGAYYQFGNQYYPTQRPSAYDANLKWEETSTQNIGLDFAFLDNRISGSFEYYSRETTDMLNFVPIAAGSNFSNFLTTNVGSMENKGWEFTLTGRPISTTDMSWEISANISHNENKITKMTLVDDPSYVGVDTGGISGGVGNNVQINAVGYPVRTFALFRQVYGVDGKPIEGLYVDKTGLGGKVADNNLNKYFMGSPAADLLMGISSRFTYKKFDVAFSGRLSIGNYVYNNNASNMALYQNIYNQSGYTANILASVKDSGFNTAQYHSDFYLENASFFRMDNISAGYNFDRLGSDKLSGRVSFTVQNAFVVTKYTGIDPEVAGGIDNNIFPRPRTYMLGINLEF